MVEAKKCASSTKVVVWKRFFFLKTMLLKTTTFYQYRENRSYRKKFLDGIHRRQPQEIKMWLIHSSQEICSILELWLSNSKLNFIHNILLHFKKAVSKKNKPHLYNIQMYGKNLVFGVRVPLRCLILLSFWSVDLAVAWETKVWKNLSVLGSVLI